MFASKNNKKLKRDSAPTEKAKEKGKDISLSSLGNHKCKSYIGGIDTRITEKINPVRSPKDEKMKTVKKTDVSFNRDKEVDKIGEIQLDTGKIEIGYDKEKDEVVFSFVRDETSTDGRKVIEDRSKEDHSPDVEYMSNDESFKNGALELRVDRGMSRSELGQELSDWYMKIGSRSTIGGVLPFTNTSYESSRIKELGYIKSSAKENRTDIHTAMSTLKNAKLLKEYKEMQLNKKLGRILQDVKIYTFSDYDDYYIWQVEENPDEILQDVEIYTSRDYYYYYYIWKLWKLLKKWLLIRQREETDPDDNEDENNIESEDEDIETDEELGAQEIDEKGNAPSADDEGDDSEDDDDKNRGPRLEAFEQTDNIAEPIGDYESFGDDVSEFEVSEDYVEPNSQHVSRSESVSAENSSSPDDFDEFDSFDDSDESVGFMEINPDN